jgi:cell division topological specificity factor
MENNMSFLSNFFKSSENSSDIAKNRLKVAITSDRAVCSPELMEQMKNDIIQVISKYLDIDTDGLDIKVTKTELDESSGVVNALLANIPIKEGSRNFRK